MILSRFFEKSDTTINIREEKGGEMSADIKKRIFAVGEILYDIFPEYKRLGGAPFNFSFHLQMFGFYVFFMSRVGNDINGKTIMETLDNRGFNTELIQIDERHPTGYVNVELNEHGVPDFDIIENVAYDDIIVNENAYERLSTSDLIYFGTLIQRTENGFHAVRDIVENKSGFTLCFYDINLRKDCYNQRIIEASLNHCDILKLNGDELSLLKDMIDPKGAESRFVERLMDRFSIEWVSLTDGANGSTLFTSDHTYRRSVKYNTQNTDTVGAGDAYASVLAAGRLLEWPPDVIIRRATEFAGAVCGISGAIPDHSSFYAPYRKWMENNGK